MMELYTRARNYFTPLKFAAFIVLCLGIIDGFNFSFFNKITYDFIINFIIRVLMFFAAFFAIFGNGKVKRTRATIISTPILYFGIYNILMYFQSNLLHYFLVFVVFSLWGLWLLLFGDYYE